MVLPEPLWSAGDLRVADEVTRNPSSPILGRWSKDPTKMALLRAINSCQARLGYPDHVKFDHYLATALARKRVCFLHSYSLEVEETKLFSGLFSLYRLSGWRH